jgi:Response regulator containing CheY-like receiver domain and AraC-type DNA-binding domain
LEGLYSSAERLATDFSTITGISCSIVNLSASSSPGMFQQHGFCAECIKLQKEALGKAKCENFGIYSCLQSERWGGKYECLCPAGLAFINTVISTKGEDKKLGVSAGPFVMTEPAEAFDDLEIFFGSKLSHNLLDEAKKLPEIECSKVSTYADVLFMLASYMVERNSIEMRILEQLAQNESEQFYQITDIKNTKAENYNYPIESEKMLQNYIAQGDKTASQKVLNEILGHIFFCSGGNFNVIKARITELIVLLSRAAISGGADVVEVFGLNYDYLNDIHNCKTMDELNRWLSNVLIRFTSTVFDVGTVKHSDIIMKIIEYVRRNYMKKITLNDISNHVNFSVSYISRIFKEEMGTNMMNFINKVRVENAKLLLMKNEIPLIEVSYLCGFEDQTYFNKVFKKLTNISPGKFRDKRGQI